MIRFQQEQQQDTQVSRTLCVMASPNSVPTVWSVVGPQFSEAFLPLAHCDWPRLLSSQLHVPFSNEQPTNSKLVSLAIRGGKE